MFKRLEKDAAPVRFLFNGIEIFAQEGDTVAAALLDSGHLVTGRNSASGKHRGPFCMMGSCYECLVELDGRSVQACQIVVVQGLNVKSLAPPVAFSEVSE